MKLFRSLLTAAALCAAVASAGCTTDSAGPPAGNPSTVQTVQNAAVSICGYLPAATTVANIVATFAGGQSVVDLASTVAQGICTAVTAKGAKRGGVYYRGVKIAGRFT